MAVDGRVTAAMRITITGAGNPPLFFVHGFACDASDWRAQVAAFAATNTVVTCDLPGHGESTAAASTYTIASCGAAVAGALDELALPPAILIGHSMGCRVVLDAARLRPDLVAGLVLVDGSRIAEGDPVAAARAMTHELCGARYQRFVRDFFGSMFVASSDPALVRAIVERALRVSPVVGRALMADLASWDAGESASALAAVRVPLLAIQSTTMDTARARVSLQPGATSPWLTLIRAQIPTAIIAELDGAGHFPQIEQADEVNALIAEFLRRELPQ
jgi:pimeloyl-ACP methyl ester carboxylesterase